MDINLNMDTLLREKHVDALDEDKIYDVIIVGGGPAAMTAAVYCMRKGLSVGLIAEKIGGQMAETLGIENYMGYKYIEGLELVRKFREHLSYLHISVQESDKVKLVSLEDDLRLCITESGKRFKARSLILATGNTWRKLEIPGEERLVGRGVAYCSTCDAPFFKDAKVAVIGGGNSGIEAALDLAIVAKEVVVIEYSDKIKADRILTDRLSAHDHVSLRVNTEIREIMGSEIVTGIKIVDRKSGKEEMLSVDGVFVEIGMQANSLPFSSVVTTNRQGEIQISSACETSVRGIFAAGDVTDVPFKQIIVAAGEGAKAALSAYNYLMLQDG